MDIYDEASALRRLATVLVAGQDNIHPAHAENRVMAAIRLAEAWTRNTGTGDIAWTMAEMTEAGWVALSDRAGLVHTASQATRSLTMALLAAEGVLA